MRAEKRDEAGLAHLGQQTPHLGTVAAKSAHLRGTPTDRCSASSHQHRALLIKLQPNRNYFAVN